MSLLSPLWLLLVAPWAALSLWLLLARNPRVSVPFIELWQSSDVPHHRVRHHLRPPPLALACALAALLCAILAAARPVVRATGVSSPITVIVDRGVTMSANGTGGTRLDEAMTLAKSARAPFGGGRITSISVPAGATDRPTALDTKTEVWRAVRQALLKSDDPVVLISDKDLHANDTRLVQIAPASRPRNAAITRLSARGSPSEVAVMATVRSDSPPRSAELRVSGAGQTVVRTIDLPGNGAEANYFFVLPAASDTIVAELVVEDDLAADNRA